ncbi:MAG: GNAT family N-acetyltransferase [Gammaproteobacteria bacterium]|jgi:predicted GNAT family N-acyltransferase
MNDFVIKQTTFNENRDAIVSIREQVFNKEQHVPEELEWDGLDDDAVQLLVMNHEQPVATSRMLNDGHIGRMAVIPAFRKQGIGSQMLSRLINIAKQKGLTRVFLSAQVEAIDFYRKHGFTVNSDIYLDAGIFHQDMYLNL